MYDGGKKRKCEALNKSVPNVGQSQFLHQTASIEGAYNSAKNPLDSFLIKISNTKGLKLWKIQIPKDWKILKRNSNTKGLKLWKIQIPKDWKILKNPNTKGLKNFEKKFKYQRTEILKNSNTKGLKFWKFQIPKDWNFEKFKTPSRDCNGFWSTAVRKMQKIGLFHILAMLASASRLICILDRIVFDD